MIRLQDDWRDDAAWDAFVRAHPQSRYCQLSGYARVVACYGYRTRHLAFLRGRELVGALPAAEVSSLLYGRRLVSQPFSEYGGLLLHPELADHEIDEALRALRAHLGRTALEIHGNHAAPATAAGLADEAEPVGHVASLALGPDTDVLWREVVKYSVRKAVKQAQTYGVTIGFDCDETVLRERFFPLYLKSMKRLGVPPHKFAYYAGSHAAFGEDMVLATARAPDGTPIAGLLGFACGGRVNIINTVSDPAHWHLKANDLLHWEMIRRTAARGHRVFDFGSVRYDGQSTYKKKWGTDLAEHANYLVSGRPGRPRKALVNASSGGMKRMSRLWSTYVPDAVGQLVGPVIRGQLAR